ncbi:DNA damage-regulated autophagy modulator protein 1-like isoform X2 [Uloborus diversus]|uniref:DNA damage-regulated autophagy modulator protein 1-like isoform X2 n=1 Tax=Uloborus diversus TaxID=327109 RepID=UPI0024096EEA|nr:DNA damage-regulated autophagy modulator protein 1-like isoform X2 [Uloborus diversus]
MIFCDTLLLLTLWLQVLGIVTPYIINIWKTSYNPPLPFISHAVGSPPENGIFTLLMIPGSFLGVILCFIIHKVSNVKDNKFIELLNDVSFWCGVIYFTSWVVISAFPFSFTDLPSQYEWIFCVLCEHMIGALLMLASSVVFVILQGIKSWITNDGNNHRWKLAIFVAPVALIGVCSLVCLAVEELCTGNENIAKNGLYILPSKICRGTTLQKEV